MAASSTLWRLHSTSEQHPEGSPVKSATVADSPPPAPPTSRRYSRFRGREEPQAAYRLDAEIMSITSADVPVDQSARLARLAEQERGERLLRQFARRRMRGKF